MPAHNINVNCRAQLTSTANETWRDYYSGFFEKQAENAQFRHFLYQLSAFPLKSPILIQMYQNQKPEIIRAFQNIALTAAKIT